MFFTPAGRKWGAKRGFMKYIEGVGGGKQKPLKWPLMTLSFDQGSSNIDNVLARYVIHMCTENQIDRTNVLGGVWEQIGRHTYNYIKSNKNMDGKIYIQYNHPLLLQQTRWTKKIPLSTEYMAILYPCLCIMELWVKETPF